MNAGRMEDLGVMLASELAMEEQKFGFVLMVVPTGTKTGMCNYISNCRREDIINLLTDQLNRFQDEKTQTNSKRPRNGTHRS